jgi:uncharacterized membrane protein YphA (DoxX/SURF4 family)
MATAINERIIHLVCRLVVATWWVQIALSHTLWYSTTRLYPKVSLWGVSSHSADCFLGITFALASLYFVLKPRMSGAVIMLLSFVAWCSLDIERFQAWNYEYILMWLGYLAYIGQPSAILRVWQIIFAATYFWSGLQKFNLHFHTEVYAWMMKAFELTKPLANYTKTAYIMSGLELLLGVGLLFGRTAKYAAILAIMMHAFVLVFIGPLSYGWNIVVWPWNMLMSVLLYVFFIRHTLAPMPALLSNKGFILLGCLLILPVLNFFSQQYYPNVLSFTMYSAHTTEGLLVYNKGEDCIPEHLFKQKIYEIGNRNIVALDDWSMKELNTPAFAHSNYYQAFGNQVCQCLSKPDSAMMIVWHYSRFQPQKDTTVRYPCTQLLKR